MMEIKYVLELHGSKKSKKNENDYYCESIVKYCDGNGMLHKCKDACLTLSSLGSGKPLERKTIEKKWP